MDVKRIAKLANLPLTDDEEKKFSNQLTAILDYIDQLQQTDTKGVEPTSQVTGLVNITRQDAIEPSLQLDKDYFRVKAILNDD